MDRFLTEKEVMQTLGIGYSTIRRWRAEGFGPNFVRFGKAIRYDAATLERWIQMQTVTRHENAEPAVRRARHQAGPAAEVR